MSERFQDARALVDDARRRHTELSVAYYDEAAREPAVGRALRIGVKGIVENLRSALDYCAKELYERVAGSGATGKTYFPISWKGATKAEFEKLLTKNIPGLWDARPDLAALLESYQEFADARNSWLPVLATICNANKHDHLPAQTRSETERIVVEYHFGGAPEDVPEIDSRGRRKVSTRPAPEVSVPALKPRVIGGGSVTNGGVPLDPELPHPALQPRVTSEVWVDIQFEDLKEPVLPFLTSCIDGVARIVAELESNV